MESILAGVPEGERSIVMASATVKIDAETYARLKATAEETGKPMIEVLAKAIDAYARQCFLEGLSADFAALRADRKRWKEELAERAVWEATLTDGSFTRNRTADPSPRALP
jgi:hypothetical protein